MMMHHQQQPNLVAKPEPTFDPYSWDTFFFGFLDRKEAERLLASSEIGTFILRESTTKPGYSLTVKFVKKSFENMSFALKRNGATNSQLFDRKAATRGRHYKICGTTFIIHANW